MVLYYLLYYSAEMGVSLYSYIRHIRGFLITVLAFASCIDGVCSSPEETGCSAQPFCTYSCAVLRMLEKGGICTLLFSNKCPLSFKSELTAKTGGATPQDQFQQVTLRQTQDEDSLKEVRELIHAHINNRNTGYLLLTILLFQIPLQRDHTQLTWCDARTGLLCSPSVPLHEATKFQERE